jgi:uncharacterized membrane protein YfcA
MQFLLGFMIAAAIGLTGVGAGVITTPILILFLHVPAAQAVGTALIFSTVVKLLAAPVYVGRKQVHWRTLAFLIAGGLPGVLIGSLLLERFNVRQSESLLYSVLGLTIVTMASLNLYKMIRNPNRGEIRDRTGWLPLIALPIGAEVGFSSAGAGALGSIALLGLTALSTGQVVGTDMFFGLAMSTIGGGIQLHAGNYAGDIVWKLVLTGIPGALLGANMAARLPSRPLRYALSVWIIGLGAQLCYRGLAS